MITIEPENGTACEIYANYKLSEKKAKSTTWYQYEPQRLSFTVYSFGNIPGNTSQQDAATNLYESIRIKMNSPEFSLNGISYYYRILVRRSGRIIFTGYVDLSQTAIDPERLRADVVCYDAMKVLSLMSGYVPYWNWSLGDLLSNTFFSASNTLSRYDFSITDALQSNGFDNISLLFSGNLLTESVVVNMFKSTNFFKDYHGDNYSIGNFYVYTDTSNNAISTAVGNYTHIFYIYFKVVLSALRITKKIKIFEITNGYCYTDDLYEESSSKTYSTAELAQADIDNQIEAEILAINETIPEWGENWFILPNIVETAEVNGYSYEYEDPEFWRDRNIKVTGNIFPEKLGIGDSSKQHEIIGFDISPNYSSVSWIDALKHFLIGNNLVMRTTASGNIEIKDIIAPGTYAADDYTLLWKRTLIINRDFEGFNGIDGDTEFIDKEMIDYYKDYLKTLNSYDFEVLEEITAGIARELKLLDSLSYAGLDYMIIKLDYDEDSKVYSGTAIEVA